VDVPDLVIVLTDIYASLTTYLENIINMINETEGTLKYNSK